jgi:ubiquitin C-terminal hydrolase
MYFNIYTAEAPIQPEYVYDAIKKRSKLDSLKGRQEDAQEFLGYLLDGLHEELLILNLREEEWHHIGKNSKPLLNIQKASRLTSIFGGKLKSIVKTGGKESVTLEPFQILSVDVTVMVD